MVVKLWQLERMETMKTFSLYLLDGTEITIKGKNYEELLFELDEVFNILKNNVGYYFGASDNTIIEELKEQELNVEV